MVQTTSVSITWGDYAIRYESINNKSPSLDQEGFYALVSADCDEKTNILINVKLLYIGKAFKQTIRERIKQEHAAYKCINDYMIRSQGILFIMTGTITESSQDNITDALILDAEACLISTNSPHCNTQSKYSYCGRNISITNNGKYSPLKQTSSCSD